MGQGTLLTTAVTAAALVATVSADAKTPSPAAEPPASFGPAPAPTAPTKASQGAPSAISKQPVDVTAQHGELFNEERRVVYTGDVVAVQGIDTLRTPQLTVFFTKRDPNAPVAKSASAAPGGDQKGAAAAFGKIERMEAEGTVYFVTPTQNAKGDHGTYLASADTITLTGNVVLLQGKNVSAGNRLVIDRKTDHSTLYSNAGAPQRVRGVFYQDQPSKPPGAAAPAAKPPSKPAGSANS